VPRFRTVGALRCAAVSTTEATTAPAVGELLRFLARLRGARTVVEVAAGGGGTALALLEGMERGAVTSVELDAERQTAAQRAYARAGVSDRVRSMAGPALTVLPRLADANYDLVFLDGPGEDATAELAEARRLLKPGGFLVAHGVEPGDAFTTAVAEARLNTAVLPIGAGVLIAT
jgi:predicted O-methyltransferase YrrM